MVAKWGMELVCWFVLDGVIEEGGAPTAEFGPPPPTLGGPSGPTVETPLGPPAEPGCARGLATGREGGVPICVCGQTRTEGKEMSDRWKGYTEAGSIKGIIHEEH